MSLWVIENNILLNVATEVSEGESYFVTFNLKGYFKKEVLEIDWDFYERRLAKDFEFVESPLKTHKLLLCHFEDCNYKSDETSNLKKHMKGHFRITTNICDICEKEFTKVNELKLHKKTHNPDQWRQNEETDHTHLIENQVNNQLSQIQSLIDESSEILN